MTTKEIATYGASRQKVRVYLEGDLIRVRWRVNGRRMTRSYPNSQANKANAKAFAKGLADERSRPRESVRLTIRSLWDKYAESEFPHLRERSKKLYREYYREWEIMWGADFPVESSTLEMMRQFRRELQVNRKLESSTVRETIRKVQMVYRWGQRNELIEVNKIALYQFKQAKADRKESPAEYRGDEFTKILAQLDPESGFQWRAFVALAICGAQGVRQNAVLHLRWADVPEALESGGYIHWRAEWDKLGRDWKQPIRALTILALQVARAHNLTRKDGPSPWVIPSAKKGRKGDVYTIQSLWSALKSAEARAGITHLEGRGGHGLRRMMAGDVAALTGDPMLAMNAIGDTDIRMAMRYVKKRDDRMAGVFHDLDEARTSSEADEPNGNQTATTPDKAVVNPLKGDAP